MANYAVNDWTTGPDPLATVLASVETKLETIDNTKTIRLLNVLHEGAGDSYVAFMIYDAQK